MKLSVVIPTTGKHLEVFDTISSCLNQALSDEFKFEVLIICNPKNRKFKNLLFDKFYHQIIYFETDNTGVNIARNLGWDQSSGEIVYFLDDDCKIPHKHHFAQRIQYHDQQKDLAILGAGYSSNQHTNRLGQRYNELVNYWIKTHCNTPGGVLSPGGNLSLRKSLFSPQQRFNPSISYGGSETEFLLRIQNENLKVKSDPFFLIEHSCRPTVRQIFRKAWLQGKNKRPTRRSSSRLDLSALPLQSIAFIGIYRSVVEFSFRAEKILNRAQNF